MNWKQSISICLMIFTSLPGRYVMKGIDHSYYYEGYTMFKAEEL